MRKIKLSNGYVALVDSDDFDFLSNINWHYVRGYAVTDIVGQKVFMHRFVAKTPKGKFTDHINHDKLDNRKANLRVCTRNQNQANRINKLNKYKGITRDKGKWRAQIKVNGVNKNLGRFDKDFDAARVYDLWATTFFGEFANPNFNVAVYGP